MREEDCGKRDAGMGVRGAVHVTKELKIGVFLAASQLPYLRRISNRIQDSCLKIQDLSMSACHRRVVLT